jgi:hypothetical protein
LFFDGKRPGWIEAPAAGPSPEKGHQKIGHMQQVPGSRRGRDAGSNPREEVEHKRDNEVIERKNAQKSTPIEDGIIPRAGL